MNIYIYRYLLYTSCLSNFFANTQSSQALPTYTLQASLDHFKSNFSSNYTYIKFKLCFQNVSDNLISVIQPPREVVICVSGADARRGSPGAQVKGDGSLPFRKLEAEFSKFDRCFCMIDQERWLPTTKHPGNRNINFRGNHLIPLNHWLNMKLFRTMYELQEN